MTELTKQMLKDMKEASRITVRRDSKGVGAFRLTFKDEVRGKTVETEKQYLVDAKLRDYSNDKNNANSYCIESEMWLDSHHSVWNTAFRCLSVGDSITFEFMADNNNDLVRAADLHVDTLRLVVYNKKNQAMVFELETHVSKDNSARMIRKDYSFSNIDPTDSQFENRLDKVESSV